MKVVYRLLAQTTLRNILGTKDLHEILSDRESISGSMQASRVNSRPLVMPGDGAGGAGRGHRVLGYQGGEG